MTNELVIVTNIVSREITGLEVVGKVNEFYSSSFDHLFQLVLALGALFGVLLPILIQFYQRQTIRAELSKQLEEKKSELLVEVEKKFSAEKEIIHTSLKENIVTIEKRLNKAEGSLFILQNSLENDLVEKCHYLCKALEHLCESDGGTDLRRAIESLTNNILPKLTKEDLESSGLCRRLENLLLETKKWNHKGLLLDLNTNFENAIQATKKRSRTKLK